MKKNDIERLQDAIGEVRGEYIEEAAAQISGPSSEDVPSEIEEAEASDSSGEHNEIHYQGNSWVALAMNPARRNKIREGKDKEFVGYRNFTAVAACILLVACLIVPKLMPQENAGTGADDFYEAEGEEAPKDSDGTASYSAYETDGEADSDAAGDVYMESSNVSSAPTESDEADETVEPTDEISVQESGEAFKLTAAEWNDNNNWPFFTNLVNSDIISFPSYGIDPRNRIKVTVMDEGENLLSNQKVRLINNFGEEIWVGTTSKDGVAYLFYELGQEPVGIRVNGVDMDLVINAPSEDPQGDPVMEKLDDLTIIAPREGEAVSGVQVMFIVDTTGSMGDELAYLQKDFASIAEETFDGNTYFSANFYRDEGDEYVTKTNGFTQNLATVQNQLNEEYAAGGGDLPEAVDTILRETILENDEWREDCNKVAFLIFDAPPHSGTGQTISEVVRNAAERGIHVVPVVASNADRDTELFGRALAIVTDGTYVFLTDDSGIGESHLEPIVGDYTVELLHDVIVRIINSYK